MALVRTLRRTPTSAFGALTPFTAVPAFEDMTNRMRRFFDEPDFGLFDTALAPTTLGWMPAMEITESANELVLTAELPGMERKDVDVSVEEGVLTIRGEKLEERKEGEEGKKFYLSERNYGAFERSFTLPRTVDASKVAADFTKGILTVHMPKSAETKPKGRKIEIGGT